MKFTPSSIARRSAATDAASSVGPYEFPCAFPPSAHAPKPISDTVRPVRPRTRVFTPGTNVASWKNLCDTGFPRVLRHLSEPRAEIDIDNCRERLKSSLESEDFSEARCSMHAKALVI